MPDDRGLVRKILHHLLESSEEDFNKVDIVDIITTHLAPERAEKDMLARRADMWEERWQKQGEQAFKDNLRHVEEENKQAAEVARLTAERAAECERHVKLLDDLMAERKALTDKVGRLRKALEAAATGMLDIAERQLAGKEADHA